MSQCEWQHPLRHSHRNGGFRHSGHCNEAPPSAHATRPTASAIWSHSPESEQRAPHEARLLRRETEDISTWTAKA